MAIKGFCFPIKCFWPVVPIKFSIHSSFILLNMLHQYVPYVQCCASYMSTPSCALTLSIPIRWFPSMICVQSWHSMHYSLERIVKISKEPQSKPRHKIMIFKKQIGIRFVCFGHKMIIFCLRLCFRHQIQKLTYWCHCASDLQTSHMTICSQGGSTSEDDELNKRCSSSIWSPQFFFWLARHFSLKCTWLYGNGNRGRMLNTPPSHPVPALWTLQMSVWHPVHCSTRMVLKELLICMFC